MVHFEADHQSLGLYPKTQACTAECDPCCGLAGNESGDKPARPHTVVGIGGEGRIRRIELQTRTERRNHVDHQVDEEENHAEEHEAVKSSCSLSVWSQSKQVGQRGPYKTSRNSLGGGIVDIGVVPEVQQAPANETVGRVRVDWDCEGRVVVRAANSSRREDEAGACLIGHGNRRLCCCAPSKEGCPLLCTVIAARAMRPTREPGKNDESKIEMILPG